MMTFKYHFSRNWMSTIPNREQTSLRTINKPTLLKRIFWMLISRSRDTRMRTRLLLTWRAATKGFPSAIAETIGLVSMRKGAHFKKLIWRYRRIRMEGSLWSKRFLAKVRIQKIARFLFKYKITVKRYLKLTKVIKWKVRMITLKNQILLKMMTSLLFRILCN